MDVRSIAEEIVGREGGFVNDKDDPGGATKYGVTIGTMRRLGIDLDRDGDVDIKDVHLLTKEKAVDIFIDHYYNKPRIHLLPRMLQPTVFDMYVNAGSNAVKILQRMLVKAGFSISVDGLIGPQTANAAYRLDKVDPVLLRDAYSIERRNYYYALADRRPASRKYARRRDGGKGGWIVRAEEFMSDRFIFSDTQHAQRTRDWV